jgi:dsDNA-specific endonuclease/ATPase MutS2
MIAGMSVRFAVGDTVQTPFGKGVVREVRNNGRLLIGVRGRAMELRDAEISPAEDHTRRPPRRAGPGAVGDSSADADAPRPIRGVPSEVDLHGMTVEEALDRAERALNDALLASLPELRFIHGRSGGRIRGALHVWLRGVTAVRSFRVDPRNEGVTIVTL